MTEPRMTLSKLDQPQFNSALFFPRKHERSSLPPAAVDLEITTADGQAVLGCRLHVSDSAAPTIIFFHGNGETVADYDDIGTAFTQVGLNIVFISYRGYGWSTGQPSVSALYQDAETAYDFVRRWVARQSFTGALLVMGRSLGSASAIDLAHRHGDRFKGLLIDSGFADSLPLLEAIGCPCRDHGIVESDCFNNRSKIADIEIPTLIFHGARDQLIPLAEAALLQAESGAKNKQLQVVPGADHNSLLSVAGPLYFSAVKQFVDGVTGVNTWRERRKRFRKEGRGQETNG